MGKISYREDLILRMKNIRYLLLDKEKYRIHSHKRRKLLIEYSIIQDLLCGDIEEVKEVKRY